MGSPITQLDNRLAQGDQLHHSVSHAIGCLESLGVTRGEAGAAFAEDRPVPRWAMALALMNSIRAMNAYLATPTDQGFEDIAGLPTEAQNAINELALLGITRGRTADRFDPYGTVPVGKWRWS